MVLTAPRPAPEYALDDEGRDLEREQRERDEAQAEQEAEDADAAQYDED